MTRRALDEAVPGLGDRVAAYRGGYLRRTGGRSSGPCSPASCSALASTNALELGVDLVGLDAVLICGYPGTRASLWQQAGRAGRAGGEALAVLVARDDPLDTYLVHHPEALFGRPVEATVLDPANPYVLGPAARAAPPSEAPLHRGRPGAVRRRSRRVAAVEALAASGALRRRPSGWYWTHRGRPDVDLRGTGGAPVVGGRVGHRPAARHRRPGLVARHAAHRRGLPAPGRLLRGRRPGPGRRGARWCTPAEPDWSTHARDVTDLSVVSVRSYVDAGPVGLFLGEVDVTNQVVSYQRRRIGTGEVIDTRPLDLPARELRTVAVWFTISPQALAPPGVEAAGRARARCTPPSTPRSACCR